MNALRKLLLIDQQSTMTRRLQISLLFEDVEVTHVWNSREAMKRYSETTWDLIVINESSSHMISVLIKLRVIDVSVPIIMSIISELSKDRVRMYHLGANDVISHPYHMDELVARINNMLHLSVNHQEFGSSIEVNDLLIDTRNRLVFRMETEIQLTPTEFELLLFLAKDAGKVHSRESILKEVWGYEFHGDTNIVDVYIRYLRIKIDKGNKKKLIKTVRGVGYMISI